MSEPKDGAVLLAGNLAPPAHGGGVERSLAEAARILRARDRGPLLLGLYPEAVDWEVELVEVEMRWGSGPSVLLNPLRLRKALIRAIRSVSGRITQIWARDATVAAAAVRAGVEAPVVYIPSSLLRETQVWDRGWRGRGLVGRLKDLVWRTVFEPLERRRERRAVTGSRVVVCFSRNLALALEEEYGEAVADRIQIVPPGVDLERFRPDLPPPDPEIESRLPPRPRAVYLGRLEERKGPQLLLQALQEVPELGAIFLGHGRDREEVEVRARDLGLDERAAFLGWVPDPERYLAASDFLALPSRSESFGHGMLEALACGRPVVGFSRSSGARTAVEDVIRDGETGILVHELDPAALAVGLERAMALVAGTPDLESRCRGVVEKGYRWDRFVSRVLELAEEGG